jgi:two-component system, NtrC family, sensor kinase
MDTVKTQQVLTEEKKNGKVFAKVWAKTNSLRFRLKGLQFTLIVPYLVLTILLASLGVFIITNFTADYERERFENSMLETSRVANDGLVNYEKNQLERLRYVIFIEGVADAMRAKDSQKVSDLVQPALTGSRISLISAIDTNGQEIVTVGRDLSGTEFHRQKNVDFSGVTIVNKILNGETDNRGDKFAELIKMDPGPILFTSAPVVDKNNQLCGVMMVGTYLNDILLELKKQSLATNIVLVDHNGNMVGHTFVEEQVEGFDSLASLAGALNQESTTTITKDITLNKSDYTVAYGPFVVRGQPVGWIGVIKSNSYVTSDVSRSRNLLVLLFSAGAIGIIFIGYTLAQNIARPILRLRSMAQAVANNDLNQNIGLERADEIGELASSFDVMTLHLRERTEEAARYNAEILQRNRELKEINERLEATQLALIQSEKLASIGQLTAGIVHDVKNPFAVIMGMSEVLQDDEGLDDATRHGLKVIRESAVKGNTIVSDLLKFARQSKPEMRYMDLRETVQTSMRLTAYLTRRYNTVTDLPEKPLLVTYDAQQVEQVLINMIHNAVQAMPNGGNFRVGLKQVDETAQISIQDSGTGISPDHLKRIFDPFFTTKPEGEGTGLGLSVSYGIIANHRGKIEVESELGKGTTFTIILPITQPSQETGENLS